jgi:glycosyltransferase involved in cell wall biosynthesis
MPRRSRVEMLKTLVVQAELRTGGAAVVHRLCADKMLELGDEVDFFSYRSDGWQNIFGSYPRERLTFQREMSLTELLCRRDYDIIHAISDAPDHGLGRSVQLSRSRARVVLTCHGYELPRADISFVHAFVTVSQTMADAVRDRVSVPVHVVYNGIDESTFALGDAEAAPRPIVLWVGRLHDYRKDFVGFLALMAEMMSDDVDFCVVAACPPEYPVTLPVWMHDRVRVMNLIPQAEMAGILRSVAASGGCCVVTSLSEGMPMSILESLACGCPMIATNVGGIGEIIDGSNGILYDRSIGASGLRKLVLGLIEDPARRQAMALAGTKTIADKFTSRHMADAYRALYESVLEQYPKPKPGVIDRVARGAMRTVCKARSATSRYNPDHRIEAARG